MKRLLFILLIIIGFSSASFANFYADLMGVMITGDDVDNQAGFGLGFGYALNQNIDLCLRGTYSMSTDHANLPNEINYEHITLMAGAAYIPNLSFLDRFRLSWKNTLLLGYSRSEVNNKLIYKDISCQGFAFAVLTGIQYSATQIISPFFDIGYHKSFYNGQLNELSVHGFQFDLGVRFYFGHSRKYDTGY